MVLGRARVRQGLVVFLVIAVVVGSWPLAAAQGSQGGVRWVRQFGSSTDDHALAVAADGSGEYVAGFTYGALPGQTSAGGLDAFLRKYDGAGNEAWTRQFGSSTDDLAYAVAADGSGLYIAGYTVGALPGQTNAGGTDVFLRKYDGAGNVLWTHQFGTPSYDYAFAVAADASSAYIVGQTSSTGFLRKYGGNGGEVWTRQLGSNAYAVAVNASDVHIAGSTFIRKYDGAGNEVWISQFGAFASALAASASGLFVAGYTYGALPGQTNAGGYDAFLARLAETPSSPQNVAAGPRDGRVSLTWDPPAFDGGLSITGYVVHRGTDPNFLAPIALVNVGTHEYMDLDVRNGVTYHYRVGAVNGIGESPLSALVTAIPKARPPLTITSPATPLTNSPSVTVAGRTEVGATLTIDGTPAAVAGDGSFSETFTLTDGAYTFTVVATDTLGQTTSATATVTVDTVAPALALTSPADASTVEVASVTVAGTTEVGARLVVNGVVVAVASTGSFSFVLALQEGTNAITATATDPAGNAATVARTVTYTNPVPGLEQELQDTQDELAATQDELAATRQELENTRNELAGIRQDLQETGAALEASNVRLASLSSQLLIGLVAVVALLAALLFVVYWRLSKKLAGRSGPPPPSSP